MHVSTTWFSTLSPPPQRTCWSATSYDGSVAARYVARRAAARQQRS